MIPFLLLPILCSLAPAAQPALPGDLTAHLREARVVHADFTQVRTLAALSRPLKASGSLVLARDQGVIWQLRTPLAITYVMGPGGLLVIDGQGRRERRTAPETSVMAQLGRVFQGLVQGDWRALEGFFTVTGEGRPERWSVLLTPRPEAAAFLRRIQLSGGRSIERIRVEEASGDRMELTFERTSTGAPLSAAETALLAP